MTCHNKKTSIRLIIFGYFYSLQRLFPDYVMTTTRTYGELPGNARSVWTTCVGDGGLLQFSLNHSSLRRQILDRSFVVLTENRYHRRRSGSGWWPWWNSCWTTPTGQGHTQKVDPCTTWTRVLEDKTAETFLPLHNAFVVPQLVDWEDAGIFEFLLLVKRQIVLDQVFHEAKPWDILGRGNVNVKKPIAYVSRLLPNLPEDADQI